MGGCICNRCFNKCEWRVLGYAFDRYYFQMQCLKCGLIYTDTAKPSFIEKTPIIFKRAH